jgi:hypothetical protein
MKLMKKIVLLAFAGLLILSCKRIPDEVSEFSTLRLVWNDDPTTTMAVIWDGMEARDAAVYYGTEDHGRAYWKYSGQGNPYRQLAYYDMHTCYVKLEDLQPDRVYYFVVRDSEGLSERYWFRTAPGTPRPFTFIAGGDTKSDDDPLEAGRASNRVVGKLRPLFVLFNGDFTSGDGTDPDRWKQWLADWNRMTTTADGRMIPIVPVHGNHEDGNKGNLNILFDAPYQLGDSSNIYYSVSFGGDLLHVIALNSQIEQGGTQRAWLEDDLLKHREFTFKAAAFHKPIWPHTSRKRENPYLYEQWAPLFHQFGLSICIDADSHMHKITYPLRPDSVSPESYMGYVRDDLNGTMFIGEGSWGAYPRQNDDDKPWTMASASFNQLKWLHVFPEDAGKEAHIKIYTVVTADYDENEQLLVFNDKVEPLTEDNLFSVPAGLKLFRNEEGKDFVTFPLNERL